MNYVETVKWAIRTRHRDSVETSRQQPLSSEIGLIVAGGGSLGESTYETPI